MGNTGASFFGVFGVNTNGLNVKISAASVFTILVLKTQCQRAKVLINDPENPLSRSKF